jgi:hypothetical protein
VGLTLRELGRECLIQSFQKSLPFLSRKQVEINARR